MADLSHSHSHTADTSAHQRVNKSFRCGAAAHSVNSSISVDCWYWRSTKAMSDKFCHFRHLRIGFGAQVMRLCYGIMKDQRVPRESSRPAKAVKIGSVDR